MNNDICIGGKCVVRWFKLICNFVLFMELKFKIWFNVVSEVSECMG